AVRRHRVVSRARIHEAAPQHLRGRASPRAGAARGSRDGRRQPDPRCRRSPPAGHAGRAGREVRAAHRCAGRRAGDTVSPRVAAALVMLIRRLTTLDDCRKVAALERIVWGYPDAEDVVPPPILIVSIKRGGILLGAFDDAGEMKGFVFSMSGVKDG